jgi:tetratricopeptide (TPR) repeat protein
LVVTGKEVLVVSQTRVCSGLLSVVTFCVLCALPAVAQPAQGAGAASSDSSKVARGRALLRAGKLKEGEAVLREHARESGNSIESLYELARVQFAADDYAKSRAACRALAAKDRHAMLTDLCMARAFLVWRRASRAGEYVDRALAKAPTHPDVLLALADYKRVSGDLPASQAAYEKVLRVDSHNPDAFYGLGELYLVAPKPEAARKAFAAALMNAVDWPEASYELGRLESPPRSVELLRAALAARPNWVEAKLALGAALLEQGETEAAEKLFREVLKASPKLALAHARLGMVLAAKREFPSAEHELKQGLAGLPNDAEAALALARVYAQTDRNEDAFEAYRNAASQEKTGSRALLEAGEFAMKLGRNTLAQAFLEKAVERTPRSAAAQARFAEVLAARGDTALARQHYQLALAGEGELDRQDVKRRIDALQ